MLVRLRPDSAFKQALRQIVARASVLFLLVGLAAMVAYSSRGQFRPYQVGSKAIEYDRRAAQILDPSERVTVLWPGLEEGRGIAALRCDAGMSCIPSGALGPKNKHDGDGTTDQLSCRGTQLAVADVWDAFAILCVRRVQLTAPAIARLLGPAARYIIEQGQPATALVAGPQEGLFPDTHADVCPESACAPVDHAGVAVVATGLLLSEPHSQRVTEFDLARQGAPAAVSRRVAYSAPANQTVHDLAPLDDSRFVLTTSKRSGGAPGETSAALQIVSTNSTAIETRPLEDFGMPLGVGVGHSSRTGRARVYIADVSGNTLRWSYADDNGAGIDRPVTFWTMKLDQAAPRLLHMVTASVALGSDQTKLSEVVFAGGPDGLYIFQPEEGVLLARYVLGRPVQGLAWGQPGELFLTAGRYVCVLIIGAPHGTDHR